MTNGTANESYAFDGVGNRTSSNLSNTYSYQPFNKLTATRTGAYTHDANGNTVTRSEGSKFWRYTYDYENRLTRAQDRKTTMRYWYDALGRRVTQLGGAKGTTKFTYDGDDVILDDAGGTLTKYLNGPGIDNKLSAKTGSNTSFFIADHLGSTNALTDTTGAITASQSYDSFGNPANATFPTRYQFTGREYDPTTGLQFSRARFYDPKLGRFISEDPIGLNGGDFNLYGYVRNNSLNRRDSLGLFPELYGDNPYDIIPESGWNAIAYAGNFAAGFGDAASLGITRYVRKTMGTDDVVDPCSSIYFAGDITGTVLPMFIGGATAVR